MSCNYKIIYILIFKTVNTYSISNNLVVKRGKMWSRKQSNRDSAGMFGVALASLFPSLSRSGVASSALTRWDSERSPLQVMVDFFSAFLSLYLYQTPRCIFLPFWYRMEVFNWRQISTSYTAGRWSTHLPLCFAWLSRLLSFCIWYVWSRLG